MRIQILAFLFSLSFVVKSQDVMNGTCTSEQLTSSQLVAGIEAEVISPTPVKLYSDPFNEDTPLVAQIPLGTILYLSSGPYCDDAHVWWQGQFNLKTITGTSYSGWLTEFEGTQQQLKLRVPTLNLTLPKVSDVINQDNLLTLASFVEMGAIGDIIEFIWSPDSQYLAINTLGAVWVYDVTAADLVEPLPLPRVAGSRWNDIGSVVFSPDSNSIATVGYMTGNLHIWSLTGIEQKTFQINSANYVGVAAIAPDFSLWAIAHEDGMITIWDADTGTQQQMLKGHSHVGALAFTRDSTYLVSMGAYPETAPYDGPDSGIDSTFRLWDVSSGEVVSVLELDMSGGKSRIALSSDGKTAAIFTKVDEQDDPVTMSVTLIDIPSGLPRVRGRSGGNGYNGDISFNSDARLFAANFVSFIGFFQFDNAHQISQLSFEQNIVDMAFSPSGYWLVVGLEDKNQINKNIVQFWATSD